MIVITWHVCTKSLNIDISTNYKCIHTDFVVLYGWSISVVQKWINQTQPFWEGYFCWRSYNVSMLSNIRQRYFQLFIKSFPSKLKLSWIFDLTYLSLLSAINTTYLIYSQPVSSSKHKIRHTACKEIKFYDAFCLLILKRLNKS